MDLLELVHPRETHKVPTQRLKDTCTLFGQDPSLLTHPYTLKSRVDLADFRDFVAALKDGRPSITPKSFAGLWRLCDEFGFEDLSSRLSDFVCSGDRELRRRVLSLEERELVRERQIEGLEIELGHRIASEADLSRRLAQAVDRISLLENSISSLTSEIEDLKRRPLFSQPDGGGSVDERPPVRAGESESERLPGTVPTPGLDSVIPSLFPFFQAQSFPCRKVVMIGPISGKTCFFERAARGRFRWNTQPTIGVDFERVQCHDVTCNLWDTTSQKRFRSLLPLYIRPAHGVLLFFDITSEASFQELPDFIRILTDCHRTRPVLLVGTKCDLADDREISTEEGQNFAADHGFGYVEVSAKTGEGVQEALAQRHSMIWAQGLTFSLLWRGSTDGFTAEAFHRCCDGRERTLTVIRGNGGNIFGGFAVPGWESPFFSKRKSDSTSTGFLFTLKNPHNLPPQHFKLIGRQESSAIRVSSKACACFGNDDLFVCGGCNTNVSHSRGFGSTYENTTGIEGRLVFTGADTFIVNEIEVFAVETAGGKSSTNE
jgi:small GTP-binding protein